MTKAADGKNVKVHYTGKLSDGTIFDTSKERDPLQFTVGAGQVIKGFDDAVTDMTVGETKTIEIPAEEAYGPYREDMIFEVGHDQFAEGVEPKVGMQLQSQGEENAPPMVARITEVTEEKVTLDANHPLAGQDLTFEIELVEAV